MTKIIRPHERRNFQQEQKFNPWAGIKEPEPRGEDEHVWLTPEEFSDKVLQLLKEKFDERECSKIR